MWQRIFAIYTLGKRELIDNMSRHKLFKTLDLDEELEDFDGAGDDNDADDLSPEDKGMMDLRKVFPYCPADLSVLQNI